MDDQIRREGRREKQEDETCREEGTDHPDQEISRGKEKDMPSNQSGHMLSRRGLSGLTSSLVSGCIP